MDCRVPNDFSGDPTQYVVGDQDQICPPTEVLISYRFKTITVYFRVTTTFPHTPVYYLYLNGKVLDRDYKSGKAVKFADTKDVQNPMVAINPVRKSISTPLYDPLCGIPHMMFSMVRHDAILANDGFVCPPTPLYTEHHDIVHENFISPNAKQLGYTIAVGKPAALKAQRVCIVGDQLITKPEDQQRSILGVRDYRFQAEYDKGINQIDVAEPAKCSPLPAYRTARLVRLADNNIQIEDLSIPGGPLRPNLSPTPSRAEYAITVVMDGARLTETTGTPDNIPNIMSLIFYGVNGTSFWNEAPKTETISGHGAMISGLYEDIPNDGSTSPLLPSYMQEWLYQKGIYSVRPNLTDRAKIITSKDKLYALRKCRIEDPWNSYRPYANCGVNGDGTGGYRADSVTFNVFKQQCLGDSPPVLSLVSFAETDTYAQNGNWDGYIAAIKTIDAYIGEIWRTVQSHPLMANKTILIVTNDHGRSAKDFRFHGGTTEAEQHILFVMVGPWVKQDNILTAHHGLIDIPATILAQFGMDKTLGVGSPMPISDPVFIMQT